MESEIIYNIIIMNKFYNFLKLTGIIFSIGIYRKYIVSKNNIISHEDEKLFNELLWGVIR